MTRSKVGSFLDDFLKSEGIYEELQVRAINEVVAWQIAGDEDSVAHQGAHDGVATYPPIGQLA